MRYLALFLLALLPFMASAQPDAGRQPAEAPAEGAAAPPPPESALAQPGGPADAPSPVSGAPAPFGAGDLDGPPPSVGDALKMGWVAVGAIRQAIGERTLVAICLAISLVIWAMLAAWRALAPRFGRHVSGRTIRVVTLILLPLGTFFSALGAGATWVEAFGVALAGPGALLLNELKRIWSPDADASGEGAHVRVRGT